MLINESTNWVLSWELRELAAIANQMGVRVTKGWLHKCTTKQSVFFASHLDFFLTQLNRRAHRYGTAYLHGKPGTGVPVFDACFETLRRDHDNLQRIQVSHSEMLNLVLESGIDPAKVFLIPIGVNLSYFPATTPELRRQSRTQLDIPEAAVVLGSFQKDGVGWGEGMEPKLVKGPDVFLRAVQILRQTVPDLFVLLSGPARGFVKAGLDRVGVPYRHVFIESYSDMGHLYHAIDLYMVASRQEGGPKAILESMASGIPLVTTRAGQAMDLVKHGVNGWLVEVGDAEGLAHWAEYAITHEAETKAVIEKGRVTANANSYEKQAPLWKKFMTGFVDLPQA
jgi:glycosyltransferase involved in cell wall biosynthesis